MSNVFRMFVGNREEMILCLKKKQLKLCFESNYSKYILISSRPKTTTNNNTMSVHLGEC